MNTNVAAATSIPQHATWRDYVALTKPRVISLLLFTALAAMFVAAKGWPGLANLFYVAIGGYMSAGAANAINMVIDSDIDGKMKRTTQRPTVTQVISRRNALIFGLGMQAGAFIILWKGCNLLSANMAFCGFLFYIFIYTLILKRRTPQNIVIGGAAGSFPPLVGWAAVSGSLDWTAWTLFALIFAWTPVHFWALAIMIKDDYAEAGIPMMPVVKGNKFTAIQIIVYSFVTAVVAIAPCLMKQAGMIYLTAAILLSCILIIRSFQLNACIDRPHALKLYLFSMLHLALLFMFLAIDRMIV